MIKRTNKCYECLFYAHCDGDFCSLYKGVPYEDILTSDIQAKGCPCFTTMQQITNAKRNSEEYSTFLRNRVVKPKKPKKPNMRAVHKSYDVVTAYGDLIKTIFYPKVGK